MSALPCAALALSLALPALSACDATIGEPAPEEEILQAEGRLYWHAGTFRHLPAVRADLVSFVDDLAHPNAGGYLRLSTGRAERFVDLLDGIDEATEASLEDGRLGDWCGVMDLADAAGYRLARFRDRATGRWFLYGRDRTSAGQAYFFLNPFARRNLVIEVPHEPYDVGTGVQGARLFLALGARALVINKEHRCSDPDRTRCDGSTSVCGGAYRESDVAHHTANTFHLLHTWYSDGDPDARFVQLHGFAGSPSDRVEVSDGTTNDVDAASISVEFARHLDRYVPRATAVDSCQQYPGEPPAGKCGSTNVQARHTNAPDREACTAGTRRSSGRFLHLEQDRALRDDDAGDGWWWGPVADALADTWPACDFNGPASDCELGPRQTDHDGCPCGERCW